MKIIFAKIDNLLDVNSKDYYLTYAQKNFKSEKKLIEHSIGRFLTALCLKNLYKIENYSIDISSKKPKLNIDLDFSISHSENIVCVGFSEYNIGIDIEFIRMRDFEKLLNRYGIEKDVDILTFYQLWTTYEAEVKNKSSNITSYKYDEYVLSVSSDDKHIEIFEALPEKSEIKIIPRFNNFSEDSVKLFERLMPLDFKL